MIIWITFFVLCCLQIALAGIFKGTLSRFGAWAMLVVAMFIMHSVSHGESGFMRMIFLCSVLMASMKAIVYREWCASGNRCLTLGRWVLFSCFWFGMDPAEFKLRKVVEWKSHGLVGGLCLILGLVGVWMSYKFDVKNAAILFICMSMGFHFGVLRIMTAFWRWWGFPVRVLFRNPLELSGFRDFWGKRWNLGYSHMMARSVKKPLTPILGEKWSMLAVFLVSGLIHELAITVPVGAGYGWPTLFFMLQGGICVMEKRGSWMMAFLCWVLLIIGIPFLFGEKFLEEIILPTRDMMKFIE